MTCGIHGSLKRPTKSLVDGRLWICAIILFTLPIQDEALSNTWTRCKAPIRQGSTTGADRTVFNRQALFDSGRTLHKRYSHMKYTHDDKLEAFEQWYKLHCTLKTVDKTSLEYQELFKKCEELKQAFNDMFEPIQGASFGASNYGLRPNGNIMPIRRNEP